ncbi:MAG: hypothetical protein QXI42_03505 [Thermoproteota archaeon]
MSKRSTMLVFPVLVLLLIVASYFLLNRIMRIGASEAGVKRSFPIHV